LTKLSSYAILLWRAKKGHGPSPCGAANKVKNLVFSFNGGSNYWSLFHYLERSEKGENLEKENIFLGVKSHQ